LTPPSFSAYRPDWCDARGARSPTHRRSSPATSSFSFMEIDTSLIFPQRGGAGQFCSLHPWQRSVRPRRVNFFLSPLSSRTTKDAVLEEKSRTAAPYCGTFPTPFLTFSRISRIRLLYFCYVDIRPRRVASNPLPSPALDRCIPDARDSCNLRFEIFRDFPFIVRGREKYG